jgi:hypothetical protein
MACLPKAPPRRLMMPALSHDSREATPPMHRTPPGVAPALALGLEGRLLRGEHLSLLGPRGSGKSTLLERLHAALLAERVPCALSSVTDSLDDITRALERAYPAVDTLGISRRAARARLWTAADRRAGGLLLDHIHCASNAMVALLRRLHGGVAGVLTAVDVDRERERARARPWRYGALSVRMPATPARELRRLLHAHADRLGVPTLPAGAERALIDAARGRPGWIIECVRLAREPRYWGARGPLLSVLCLDTEALVRYRALDLLRCAPPASAAE